MHLSPSPPQLHFQRLPQPADQLAGGLHRLPVQHHRQRGIQHVVRLHHGGWHHAQQASSITPTRPFPMITCAKLLVALNALVCLSVCSCEDLQDTDLELGLDNSAFYDQFAIAQVRTMRLASASFSSPMIGPRHIHAGFRSGSLACGQLGSPGSASQ